MIPSFSYLIPFIGIAVCFAVLLSSKIDTRCPIRACKLVLWFVMWTSLIVYDWPDQDAKAMVVNVARVILLAINILYIIEAMYYIPRRIVKRKHKKTY